MTRDEIVALIARRVGNRTGMDDDIVEELKLAQTQLEAEAELPWFLLSEMSTSNHVTAGEERVSLPSDYLRHYEDGFLWYYDDTAADPWVEIPKDDYRILKAAYTGTGIPKRHALRGLNLTLHPTPAAAYTLKMVYFQQADPLTTNIENVWGKYAPDVLLNRAGIAVAENLQHAEALGRFTAQYTAAKGRMDADTIARHETGATRSMGD